MRLKKLLTVVLLIVLFMSQLSFIQFNNFVYAKDTGNGQKTFKFHYDQLDDTSKRIYDGLVAMENTGMLKTGTENYDLVEKGHFTSDEIKSYENGTVNMKKAFYAARYAFYADYPEVFYVDFQRLAIRTTKDAQGNYHAYIGKGSNKDYFIKGFTSKDEVEAAITEFNEKVNEIVEEVNNLEIAEGKNVEAEKMKYVHNKITKTAGYRYETDCKLGNEGFLGTPYGILVKGEGVCEGYARAFKTILDRLNITCILVQGVHQSSEGESPVGHMWNYVQIKEQTMTRAARTAATEGKWYAVDVTLDDPFVRKAKNPNEDYSDREPGWDIVEGFEHSRFLLVGQETMNAEHIAVEAVEAADGYVFKYPVLEEEDLSASTIHDSKDGLLVKFKQEGTQTEEYTAGDFFISYNGMGYHRAAEQGAYILMKYYQYKPGDGVWLEGKWGYLDDSKYASKWDKGDHIYLIVPNGEYVEFAVTTLKPGETGSLEDLSYKGDESDFIARSEKIHNPNGDYKGKPYIKKMTPAATASLAVGTTYPVTVIYDDDLVLEEGATEVGYKFVSSGPTGAEAGKIEDFQWDGKRTITFKFTPSKMFADDGASYSVYPTGIVGKNSKKAPMEVTYGAVNTIACAFSMNAAKSWNVFGRPTLLENEDLSLNGWKTEDGEDVADKLKNRITLVTTKTTLKENETMNELMDNKLQNTNQEVLKSETYNISLNVCKKYVVRTGHRLRISLGFPEGYGPEDAGVTFKAYHFKRDNKGNVTGVEEIPCVVTQYGLIITCDSFSPFAIAAVNVDETQPVDNTKKLIISSPDNGVINAKNAEENTTLKQAGNILDINENESKTFTITPNEGYEIENVTVCGKTVEVTGRDSMEVTANYNDVKDGNGIIEATFVAKEVAQEEASKGETVVTPKATPAQITMPESKTTTINQGLTITPTVSETAGVQTYQWYKDGEELPGKTNKVLEIEKLTSEDTGNYTLKVTTTVDTTTETVMSDSCNVVVRSFETTIDPVNENLNLEELNPGDEFEVKVNISNLKNLDKGFVSLAGQLEYNSDVFERLSITGENGWNLENNSFNEANLKFATDNNSFINTASTICKIKFKVKDTVTPPVEELIKVKGITASRGDGVIRSNDAQLKIKVEEPEEPEKPEGITSEKYEIGKDYISKIAPGTTINKFKSNVETEQELVFIDKEGNILGGDAILGTGMTVKVGKTLEFTLVVTADIDTDKEVTINDLAKIKLHYIEKEALSGIYLKAADVDYDDKITVNDIALIKLVIIGEMEIE